MKGYKTSTDKAITRIPQSKLNVGVQVLGDAFDSNLKYNHYFCDSYVRRKVQKSLKILNLQHVNIVLQHLVDQKH